MNKVTSMSGALQMLRAGHHARATEALRRRWGSAKHSYGLRRDLAIPFEAPQALVPLEIIPAQRAHLDKALADESDLPVDEVYERASRRRLRATGMGTCWAAVTESGDVAYIQWLFSAANREGIADFFGGMMPMLAEDEALLEGAYTAPAWRGKRVMAAAMARIAEQARPLGARYVLTFVGVDNPASLKGCARAGFATYTERVETWHRFRKQVTFAALPGVDQEASAAQSSSATPREADRLGQEQV
jgi:GNAT superfamily N-acetyltransferase